MKRRVLLKPFEWFRHTCGWKHHWIFGKGRMEAVSIAVSHKHTAQKLPKPSIRKALAAEIMPMKNRFLKRQRSQHTVHAAHGFR
jgi:hypothetical protein